MKTLFTIILISSLCSLQAQTIETQSVSVDSKKEFKNQGVQEDSFAEQFFKRYYSRQSFGKYDSAIVISGDTIKYSHEFFIAIVSTRFKSIFSNGIFYPTIIIGQRKNERLTISNFEELKFLSNSPTQKRFRFWLYRKKDLNPAVCFIELTNQNATDKTNIETFISGASLTFYKEGWIVI